MRSSVSDYECATNKLGLYSFTGDKYFYKDMPNRKEKGKLLPERYRKIFLNKQIVREVPRSMYRVDSLGVTFRSAWSIRI